MKNISSAAKIGLVLSFGLASGAFAQDFCNASHTGTKKTVSFSVGAGADKGETGQIGDYHYEQWNKSGSATTDFYTDGSFSCSFSNTDDFLCREGLFYGSNSGKDPLSVGNLVADYSMKTFTNDKSISYAYAGIYGWMQNPLIEWYIVDNWGPASRPNWLGTSQGKITVDGAEYEIFTADANRASIEGNKPFKQIYSLRSTARKCGTISITEHFKAWKQKGITLGSSLYEAKVLGEAGQYPEQQGASGKIDFNYAKVYVSDGSTKPTSSSSAAPKSSSSQGGGSTVSGKIDACKDAMGHGSGEGKTDRGRDGQSATGNVGSSPYHYEIWYQGGNNSMTSYDNGTFKASWSGTNDFLARVGFKYDEKSTYEDVGPIDAYFNWKKQGSAGGYNYIGIYGWTVDPLVEYYIVDDWFNKPGANLLGQRKGEFTVDGDTYEIWQNTRVQQPSIKNTQTFPQYFSVRKSARSCGHIDITAHFKKWESLGMKMGKMYEAKVLVEAGGGSGSFDVTYFKMTDKKHPLPQPESSSSEAKSSSSKKVESSSSSTIGIHMVQRTQLKSGEVQVFDMQGRYLGNVKVEAGAIVNDVLKANFKNSGIYMVKQGAYMQRFSVK